MSTRQKFIATLTVIILGFSASIAALAKELDMGSRSNYICYKVEDGAVKLDGRLDEDFWIETPDMEFREMVTGSSLPFPSKAKMVWDINFLYVGYLFKDTDVYSKAKEGVNYRNWPKNHTTLCLLHHPFAKLFLDPDADGVDCMEVHIDAHGNLCDLLQVIPNCNQHHHVLGIPAEHLLWEWNCDGIETAVYVDGTLNNSEDIDKGWSVELAIPWKSIAQLTIGKCPPVSGDKWLVSTQRTLYVKPESKRIYGSWPVMGIVDSHVIDSYGFLVFSDKKPQKLDWKLVWIESMPQETDAQIEDAVIKAKSLGFNAIAWDTLRWEAFIYACRVHNMESYGVISFDNITPLANKNVRYQIKQGIAKGYTGVAFTSMSGQETNKKELIQFYEKMNKYAKSYAKSLNRSIKTACDSFYDSHMPMDYCGVHFIEFHGKRKHVDSSKTAEEIRGKITSIKKKGAETIQFCELGIILAFPKVAKVISEELGGDLKMVASIRRRISKPLYDKPLTEPDK